MHSAFPRPLLNSPPNAKVPGGSVSRREHAHLQRPRTTSFARGAKSAKTNQLEPQLLFGREGSGGRGASLREAASPPRKSDLPSTNAKVPGGSVSRREHAHLQRTRTTPSQGEPSQPKPTNSNPQLLFGREGSGGRGASLREAASPPRNPDFPFPNAKVPGGSVSRREHAHLQRTHTTPLQGEPSQPKPTNSNPSRSSGERGLGGEALLSEKRPLPQKFSRYFTILIVWN